MYCPLVNGLSELKYLGERCNLPLLGWVCDVDGLLTYLWVSACNLRSTCSLTWHFDVLSLQFKRLSCQKRAFL